MSTIPASYSVTVTPSVLASGGNDLALNGLCLTQSNRVPIGQVYSFASPAAVASFFGAGSTEAINAGGGLLGGLPAGSGYFGGFSNSSQTPGAMLFAQYNASAVGAYLRGGSIAALTLAQLQAITGTLNLTVDGYPRTVASLSLAAATSFSNAASIIQTALNAADPTEGTFTGAMGANFTATQVGTNLTTSAVTGVIAAGDVVSGSGVAAGTTIVSQTSGVTGGAGVYVTSLSGTASSASCTTASNTLYVSSDSGLIAPGQLLAGNSVAANTVITANGTGTGGNGSYIVSGTPQHLVSGPMTSTDEPVVVTYDSVSGGFIVTSGLVGSGSTMGFATGTTAATLALTNATGGTLSQGAAAATPGAFMNGIVGVTQNWASFFTNFDPDGGSGNALKLAFAAWTSSVSPRYVYICGDGDVTAPATVPATGSLGYLINTLFSYSGTCLVWESSDLNHAAFVSGAIASLNFNQLGGRISFAYKTQPGLFGSVSNLTAAVNLGGNPQVNGSFGNGYNFVGAFGTANQNFVNFQRGTISGPYAWLDGYVNQIALTNALQLAAYQYMTQVNSFPYNTAGYANFESALQSTIQQFLNFGAYSPGVPLSSSQIAQVDTSAGIKISNTLQSQGWYLQILPANATVRASRGSPPITFWYVDGGSVQSLNVGSVALK